METIASILYAFDEVLDTKRKRHIAGGALISVSALFAGLAITIITIDKEEDHSYE